MTKLEICVDEILVSENGERRKKTKDEKIRGNNFLTFEWKHANFGPEIEPVVFGAELKDAEVAKIWQDANGNPVAEYKRRLFKTTVEGKSLMLIELNHIEKVSFMEKLAHALIGGGIKFATGALGGIGGVLGAAAAKEILGTPKARTVFLGRASLEINETAPNGTTVVEFPLDDDVKASLRKLYPHPDDTQKTHPDLQSYFDSHGVAGKVILNFVRS